MEGRSCVSSLFISHLQAEVDRLVIELKGGGVGGGKPEDLKKTPTRINFLNGFFLNTLSKSY